MALNPHYNYGLLLRALAASLLLHVVLILQPRTDEGMSHSSPPKLLTAILHSHAVSAFATTVPAPVLHVPHEILPARARQMTPAAEQAAAPREQQPATEATGVATASRNTGSTNDAATLAAHANDEDDLNFAEGKKAYLFAIAAEARRVKKYPPRAVAAGWAGTAEIRIVVSAGGVVQPPQLYKSSDLPDLDNAALAFVGIALKRTPVPEKLRGQAFDLVVPVIFNFKDE